MPTRAAPTWSPVQGNKLVNKQRLDEKYRQAIAGSPPKGLGDACIESYGLKPKKFLKPLLEQYGDLLYSFKMFYPNGGPFGFVDVATGQVDVYFALKQPYVDVFSGLDIACKAGLVVSDFEGKPFRLQTDNCKTTLQRDRQPQPADSRPSAWKNFPPPE